MLKDMKTHTHLKPGQKGTRRLVERFGDSLLCVRYRYDEIRRVRVKTAEIIGEERPGRAAPRLWGTDAEAGASGKIKSGWRAMGSGGKALACAIWAYPRR